MLLVRTAVNVLDDDDHVVDDQTDRDGQTAHRHQVDRSAERPHEDERRDHRERKRQSGDRRQSPVAEKDEQHDDGEQAADENRVTDARNRVGDEFGEVVDTGHRDAGRQHFREPRQRFVDADLEVQDVGADLLRDAQRDRVAAVARDEQRAVGRPAGDGPQVGHPDRGAVLHAHRRLLDVLEPAPEPRRQRQVLLTRFVEAADRRDQVLGLQRLGDFDDRHASGLEAGGVEDDLDFARIAREDLDRPGAGNAGDLRLHNQVRVVVQIGCRQAAGQAHDEHGEDGRRHPLDLQLGSGRQRVVDLGHPVLHHLQRHDHVCRRGELGGDLAGAADASRSHPADPGHAHHRLLDRPSHDERHRLRRQGARVRHDGDPRKLERGIDAARQREAGDDPTNEQRRGC